eukprot:Sdes_comp16693_c0_seq1m5978
MQISDKSGKSNAEKSSSKLKKSSHPASSVQILNSSHQTTQNSIPLLQNPWGPNGTLMNEVKKPLTTKQTQDMLNAGHFSNNAHHHSVPHSHVAAADDASAPGASRRNANDTKPSGNEPLKK